LLYISRAKRESDVAKSILVVDDDRAIRSFVSLIMREQGYDVDEAENGRKAIELIKSGSFDLVITDLKMPDMTGIELMKETRNISGIAKWIIITAYGSIHNAVEAMKLGVSDYLTKPFSSPDELRHVVGRVLKDAESEQRISILTEEIGRNFPPFDKIFLGKKMTEIKRHVTDVAATTATVLITGQSGTGKELVAKAIHQISPRKSKPFIAVHCAALSENLLESELFGHEKGAFTGALNLRKGRFELADTGTLFLDEIGEISPSVQVKLLRVIQERTFERVGGLRSISVDVRIIASTNRDLKKEVDEGRFREDLYYRLNVFPVKLPALSEREETILPLAEYFLAKYSTAFGKKIKRFTKQAQDTLLSYHWPGNIRELQNIIERAAILAETEIDTAHLKLDSKEADGPASLNEGHLKSVEKDTIIKILSETEGNRKKAADILGISLRTLQYRIKEYGL
jgi:two-component system, NtrC family, response regulator AtoC